MKNLSIRLQVLLLVVLSLFVLGGVTSFIAVTKSKDALLDGNSRKLETVHDLKKTQMEKFFLGTMATISVLSKSNNVEYLADDLYRLEEKMDFFPEKDFPVNDLLAQDTIEPYERFFKSAVAEFGYEDILLINVNNGQVTYSVKKGQDFGANLKVGKYKTSTLAEVWANTIASEKPTFVDMKPYAADDNKPMMFLGAPVYVEDELNSILVFKISGSSINKIMQERIGYGKTQEDYLVGSDHLTRSDSVLNPKKHSILSSFSNPKANSINTVPVLNAFKNKNGTGIYKDYNGKDILCSYSTVDVGSGIKWAILSIINEDEVLILPNEIRNFLDSHHKRITHKQIA